MEEMAASYEAVKVETAHMRDEALRARDEALRAQDEVFMCRDEVQGLNTEASMAKANTCRMRDEATAFWDEEEHIYMDITTMIDDHENHE